jgi:hypothetical protein
VDKLIGSETEWAKKKREYREKKDNVPLLSSKCPTEIDIDKEKDKEIEKESEVDVGEQDSPTTTDNSLKPIGGKLGRGLVMLTDSQFDDLMDRLSNAEIDTYISKMADMIEKGYTFRCSHYQYILKMVEEDRRTR